MSSISGVYTRSSDVQGDFYIWDLEEEFYITDL